MVAERALMRDDAVANKPFSCGLLLEILPYPGFDCSSHFGEATFKEVVRTFNDDKFLGRCGRFNQPLQGTFGGELIARPADKKLRPNTLRKKRKVVVALVHRNYGCAQSDIADDIGIGAGSTK